MILPALFNLPVLFDLIAAAGLAQALAGLAALRRFQAEPQSAATARPAVSILKPLHGAEALLEEALASACVQDYPDYQIVFGVQNSNDPALEVVDRLRRRFPHRDIAVVADAAPHGANRKIDNLINMLPAARHDVLVIADSDVHWQPDAVERIVQTLETPGTGLATTAYAGQPATPSLAGALGASWISHNFLPGVLLGRWLGRQDCLGATMALRRSTLDSIGGLAALSDHLADDAVLGRLVQRRGLAVRLAPTVAATTVPETTLAALFRHELRWARTIRTLAPVSFALSAIQYPLFWAVLAMLSAGGAGWSVLPFLAAWVIRALTARGIDQALGSVQSGLATPALIWLLPLRDLMSVLVILAGYAGDRVEWRGEVLRVSRASSEI